MPEKAQFLLGICQMLALIPPAAGEDLPVNFYPF